MLSFTSPFPFCINPGISNFVLPIVTEGASDKAFIPDSPPAGNKSSAVYQPITNAYDTVTALQAGRDRRYTPRSLKAAVRFRLVPNFGRIDG